MQTPRRTTMASRGHHLEARIDDSNHFKITVLDLRRPCRKSKRNLHVIVESFLDEEPLFSPSSQVTVIFLKDVNSALIDLLRKMGFPFK